MMGTLLRFNHHFSRKLTKLSCTNPTPNKYLLLVLYIKFRSFSRKTRHLLSNHIEISTGRQMGGKDKTKVAPRLQSKGSQVADHRAYIRKSGDDFSVFP
jgi:hypothetical protein